ncbi:MAG: phosphoglycerate kinase [Mesorhizobium sp.]|nr:MAG: phosphoglycerate kinase [Mesorhizobium sp.]
MGLLQPHGGHGRRDRLRAVNGLGDIRSVDVAGRRVLVRADLNVPLRNGTVADTTRIDRFAPTVTDLVARGARVVLMTHLGRPAGDANPVNSARPVADRLARASGYPVTFVPDCVGTVAEHAASHHEAGTIQLLENLRFHKGEEENSRSFALRLSVNGDIYVNDAFSCAHRAHASTQAIVRLMPAYAGPSLLAEVAALETVLENPVRPVAALVGGAKVSSKIAILEQLVTRMDHLVIGGGMANTFLAAKRLDVGRSLHERECIGIARTIMAKAAESGCRILLPDDVVVAHDLNETATPLEVPVNAIPADRMALDVGCATVMRIGRVLEECRTLLWNGPLGAFEIDPFGRGTFAVARYAAELVQAGRLTVVAGGGDTAAALSAARVGDRITYLSTAGGAFLEWLEGRSLPGIEALRNKVPDMEIA